VHLTDKCKGKKVPVLK